jgi:hypothetical protein
MWTKLPAATSSGTVLLNTARVSVTLMRKVFRDRTISNVILPPRSPYHTPSDYYVWGAMKGAVYIDNPRTLFEMNEAIAYFFRNITSIELLRVSTSMRGPFSAFLVT